MNVQSLLTSTFYSPVPIFNPFLTFPSIERNKTPSKTTCDISVQTSPLSPTGSNLNSREKWDYSVKDVEKYWKQRDAIYWVVENSGKKSKSQINYFLTKDTNVDDTIKQIIISANERQYSIWKKDYFLENGKLFKKFQKKGGLPRFFEFLSKEQMKSCIKHYHYDLHMKDPDTAYKTIRKKYWPISRKFVRVSIYIRL